MRPLTPFFTTLLFAVSTVHAEEPLAPLDATPAALEARALAHHPAAADDAQVVSPPAVPAPAPEPAPEPNPEPNPEPPSEPAPAIRPDAANRPPAPGDCAIFREGGAGYILKAPTYYLKGKIVDIYRRPHYMSLCPNPGRTRANYRREDWLRLAEAYPCVSDPARAREVEAVRVKVEVADWDTPWSVQHGRNGWLMRGHFLDVELKEGVVVDIDGTLLEYCED